MQAEHDLSSSMLELLRSIAAPEAHLDERLGEARALRRVALRVDRVLLHYGALLVHVVAMIVRVVAVSMSVLVLVAVLVLVRGQHRSSVRPLVLQILRGSWQQP